MAISTWAVSGTLTSVGSTQLTVLEASTLFFKSKGLNAYLSCRAFGLLFHPRRLHIFEKNISIVSRENRYVRTFSNGKRSLCKKFLLMASIERADI